MRSRSLPNIAARSAAVLATTLLIAACISPPARSPAPRPAPPVTAPTPAPSEPAVTTTPLETGTAATSPWDYIALARNAVGDQRTDYLLEAIEGFLDLKQEATARTLLEQLAEQPLNPTRFVRRQLLLARSMLQSGRYGDVERVLGPLSLRQDLSAGDRAETLRLRAEAQASRGDAEAALRLMITREPLLVDPADVADNQEQIWRLLGVVDGERLQAISTDATSPTLAQWAELALINQRAGWNPHALRLHLERWRQAYPGHPASRHLVPHTLQNLGGELTQYRQVALLLPLSSGFGRAAEAVRDGFLALHQADTNPGKPRVAVYDTGENPDLIGFYYEAAVRDGAQLVVGPLGKIAVDALAEGTDLDVPTLLLGNSELAAGRPNALQFGLSPEDEARDVARRAFADGHRAAAILYPETDWGIRQLAAFREQWDALGGEVAETGVYNEAATDFSQPIKLILDLDESESRHRELERVTAADLEFVAKRRHDIDFLFLIARSDHGRLLKPQLNFFKASDLPTYAISQIYTGGEQTIQDIDLDGVIFGDMPWLVLDGGMFRAIRESLPEANRYRGKSLDRLYALGIDSYQLLFRIERMKANPQLDFQGTTGRLSLGPEGSVRRELEWARFEQGMARPIGWKGSITEGDGGPRS